MLCIFGVIYSNSSKHMFYLHYFVLNVSQRQLVGSMASEAIFDHWKVVFS